MYVNGLEFWAIERITGVNHNTIIRWVKKSAEHLPNAPREANASPVVVRRRSARMRCVQEIPKITEIDGEGRCFASSLVESRALVLFRVQNVLENSSCFFYRYQQFSFLRLAVLLTWWLRILLLGSGELTFAMTLLFAYLLLELLSIRAFVSGTSLFEISSKVRIPRIHY